MTLRQGHLPWSQPMFRTDVTLNVTRPNIPLLQQRSGTSPSGRERHPRAVVRHPPGLSRRQQSMSLVRLDHAACWYDRTPCAAHGVQLR
jgi:hypothetical protein